MILSQTAKTPEHSASWFRTLVVPSFSQSCQVSIFSDYNLNTCKKCKKMWYFYKICYLALQELIGEWILILWLPLYKLEISISWPHSSVTSVPKSDCSRWLYVGFYSGQVCWLFTTNISIAFIGFVYDREIHRSLLLSAALL